MWSIEEHPRTGKQLDSASLEIQKRYEKWKDIARVSGPLGLRGIRVFRDEALTGKWSGYRSSRLNVQYCVIFRVLASQLLFQIVEVTLHDYRRR